jgi:hypothetical protein
MQIIDLYLQCYRQEEIVNKTGESQPTVSRVIQKFKTELLNNPPVPESLQLYNVWNFQNRDTRYGLDMESASLGKNLPNDILSLTN